MGDARQREQVQFSVNLINSTLSSLERNLKNGTNQAFEGYLFVIESELKNLNADFGYVDIKKCYDEVKALHEKMQVLTEDDYRDDIRRVMNLIKDQHIFQEGAIKLDREQGKDLNVDTGSVTESNNDYSSSISSNKESHRFFSNASPIRVSLKEIIGRKSELAQINRELKALKKKQEKLENKIRMWSQDTEGRIGDVKAFEPEFMTNLANLNLCYQRQENLLERKQMLQPKKNISQKFEVLDRAIAVQNHWLEENRANIPIHQLQEDRGDTPIDKVLPKVKINKERQPHNENMSETSQAEAGYSQAGPVPPQAAAEGDNSTEFQDISRRQRTKIAEDFRKQQKKERAVQEKQDKAEHRRARDAERLHERTSLLSTDETLSDQRAAKKKGFHLPKFGK